MEAIDKVLSMLSQQDIQFVDLRFTDTRGKEQHVTIPSKIVDADFFQEGKMFDGSSIAGWKGINESDMTLMPDANTAVLDPFMQHKTLNIRCDVLDPISLQGYDRCPRSIAKKAEHYLQQTGVADKCFFGPEPEFFVLDDVRWQIGVNSAFYAIDSDEAVWNSGKQMEKGNSGHRPGLKGGYFPVPPVDSSQDLRSKICLTLENMGLIVETHHHEVATGCQNEISTEFNTLVRKADEMQILKYVVQNMAHKEGKTATFMPKPIVGDNGSGMHVHQSIMKNNENLFSGNKYAGLSDTALHYIGGIKKHARALNAFTNATTNSYKRLVPGFEAPVHLAYSARNRSAAIRVPYTTQSKARRIEVRFPDPTGNPYLAFSAMLLAGLDGIMNQIHPGDPMDKDLYDLPPEETKDIPMIATSLQEALQELDKDRAFLTEPGVFSENFIDSYIDLKKQEIQKLMQTTHPVEFELYYSL